MNISLFILCGVCTLIVVSGVFSNIKPITSGNKLETKNIALDNAVFLKFNPNSPEKNNNNEVNSNNDIMGKIFQ